MNQLATYRSLFIALTCCCLSLKALATTEERQNFELQARVTGLSAKQVYLLRIYGATKTFVDSASVNENGAFTFFVPAAEENIGLYQVILGETVKSKFNEENAQQSFDVIITPGKTILSTSFDHPLDSMKVAEGMENQHYYEYLDRKNKSTGELQLLENMLQLYPNDCTSKAKDKKCFYKTIQKQYNQVQRELLAYTGGLIKKYPTAFFTRIIDAEQYPILDATLPGEARSETLREHFFKHSDFSDSLLLHSDVLTNKIITYIGLYHNKQYKSARQTNEFIKAIDQLVLIAKPGDATVYQYTLGYLLEGFNLIKQDAVLAYITDHYLPEDACEIKDENLKTILKRSNYARTIVGANAPQIAFDSPLLPKSQRSPATLSDIRADHTLLLFWASWCPHCTKILPELKKVYDNFKSKGFEVLAVSLDVDSLQWKKTIGTGEYNWLNYSDFKKWDSPIAREYNVIATPTMFLLDKDKKIVAKPATAQELANYLTSK